MNLSYADYVPVFKALSDETRLKILDMLCCGERCACDLLASLRITQPTLSYHMKLLTECGLVAGRRDGPWMRYTLDRQRLSDAGEFLNLLASEKEPCICDGAVLDSRCEERPR